MIQCMICLEDVKQYNQQIIEHNKCKYIIHKECCYKYDKCLFCHKKFKNIIEDQLLDLIDQLINNFVPQTLNCTYEDNPAIYLLRINYIFFIIIFCICPIILIYKLEYNLVNFSLFFSFIICFWYFC